MLMESLSMSLRRIRNILSTMVTHRSESWSFLLFHINLHTSHGHCIVVVCHLLHFGLNRSESVFVIYGTEKHIQHDCGRGWQPDAGYREEVNEAKFIFLVCNTMARSVSRRTSRLPTGAANIMEAPARRSPPASRKERVMKLRSHVGFSTRPARREDVRPA